MSQFTVRVELHKAAWSDYESLHAAMEQKGFSRTITSENGKTYALPTAEYYAVSNLTRAQILDHAKTAANTTGKSNAVLVTEAQGCTWLGLQQLN